MIGRLTSRRTENVLRTSFIYALFCGIYFPSLFNVAGLRIRANQLLLPFTVPYLILIRRRNWRIIPAHALGLTMVWLAFIFWTVFHIARGTLTLWPGESWFGSVGRCFLFAVNLMTYAVAYLLTLRSRNLTRVIEPIAIGAGVMGLFGLLGFVAYQRGIWLPGELISPSVMEPVLRNGVVVGEEITRQYAGPNKGTYLAGLAVTCLMMATRRNASRRMLYVICGALCTTGMVIAISRGAMLALLVGTMVMFVILAESGQIATVIRCLFFGAAIMVLGWMGLRAMPDRGAQTSAAFLARVQQLYHIDQYSEGTAGQRRELWGHLIDDIRANPFWGNGMDAYERYYPVGITTTENFLLEVMHATGVWGTVPLLAVVASICFQAWRLSVSRRIPPDRRAMIGALLAGYVGIFVGALTNSLWGGGLFWGLLGFLAGAADLHRAPARRRRRVVGAVPARSALPTGAPIPVPQTRSAEPANGAR